MVGTRSGRGGRPSLMTASSPSPVPFRFAELPTEIQLLIFQLFVPHHTAAVNLEHRTSRVAFLTLNKTIYETLAPAFYLNSVFHFDDPAPLQDFLGNASSTCQRNIRAISYRVKAANIDLSKTFEQLSHTVNQFAKCMTNLSVFRITHIGQYLMERDSRVLNLLDGILRGERDTRSYWCWRTLHASAQVIGRYSQLECTLQAVLKDYTIHRKVARLMHGTNVDAIMLSFSRISQAHNSEAKPAKWEFTGRVLADEET